MSRSYADRRWWENVGIEIRSRYLAHCASDKNRRMNPMHRETDRSAGLHVFQELSTLGQQLAHTLLLRQGLGRIEPVFPASMPRPR